MPNWRKILKWAARMVLFVLTLTGIYLVAAYALSRITVNADARNVESGIAIYIKSNGVHTDIAVPVKSQVKDWTDEVRFDQTKAKELSARYISFGWGDRDFYLHTPKWADLKFKTAFNAAFYLGTSVMHTQFYDRIPESYRCKKLLISEANYKKLVAFLSGSFRKKDGQTLWIPNSGYGIYDTFYEANGKYSVFKTCNTWANQALQSANQKAAFWTATDTGILCHYR